MLSEKPSQTTQEAPQERGPMEKRKNARSGLAMENQANQFTLLRNEESFDISRVRDVSISGIGLESPHPFREGEQVALAYEDGDFRLNINGRIMWCKAENDQRYAMGIEFDHGNRQDNALFFLAIRKYLDEFDGTYIDA